MNLPIASDSHAPALRVESLHALAYCQRLFYLQEIERISVPHEAVYAGRNLHASLEAAEEEGEWVSLELASQRLGLIGKVDCVRRRSGEYIPFEHKRGKAAREYVGDEEDGGKRAAAGDSSQREEEEGGKMSAEGDGGTVGRPATTRATTRGRSATSQSKSKGTPAAWPSDRLQVIAYAAMLEEAFGEPVPEGRVRYHADNVTVRVAINDDAKRELAEAIETAHRLREQVERPPITENERLCPKCSLAPVCLPEEARAASDAEHQPVRLFPPDRDGTTLHVISHGARVGASADSLVVRPVEGPETKKPIRGVDTVLLHGMPQISTQAIRLCMEHGVGVHWLTVTGRHLASLVANAGHVQRRIRQYAALSDEPTCVRLARALVHAKVEAQHRYLLRASRGENELRKGLLPMLDAQEQALQRLASAASRDSLRGYEGTAAAQYFEGLRRLLSPRVPEELRFATRNRRPPLDRFNAILSFGYGLLHTAVMRGVLASGLEPALGFFHTPRSAAYPLVLDLMELFRVPLWDMVVVGALNRGQWDPEQDFVVTRAKVWLSDAGRKKAIGLFESRLEESWKHPVLDYSLSYFRTIELESRLLEKEWAGEPGLFAQSRLR